jgi:hypothetical protein
MISRNAMRGDLRGGSCRVNRRKKTNGRRLATPAEITRRRR